MSSVDYYQSSTNSSLVGKILEQGQRLRNAMVQTILSNDPFNKEVLSNNSLKSDEFVKIDSNVSSDNTKNKNSKNMDVAFNSKPKEFENFKDKDVYICEEKLLQELGIKSDDSFVHSSYNFTSCPCEICKEYNKFVDPKLKLKKNSSSEQKYVTEPTKGTKNVEYSEIIYNTNGHYEFSQKNKPQEIKKPESSKLRTIKNTYQENQNIIKYVDSLKIIFHSLKLNTAGKRKIHSNKEKLSTVTYFVEYSLPNILIRDVPKSIAKVNSGLNPKNTIRFCSKKLLDNHDNTIHFKNSTVHTISNIGVLDLGSINIDVFISCRSVKQHIAEPFGKASLNLGYIITNPALTVDQEISVFSEKVPVQLGSLTVTLQFGCDKLHFGKEFIDAINCNKNGTDVSFHIPSEESLFRALENEYHTPITETNAPVHQYPNATIVNTQTNKSPDYEHPQTARSYESHIERQSHVNTPLLYCFVQITEAQLLGGPISSYLVCYGLNTDDIISSQIIYNNPNPVFNFYQLIPLLYDENFLEQLQDRYIVIEVWEKRHDRDQLVGITKLSLHRFFVIFRNPQVVKHLFKNQNPVVGLDWFEPITNVITRKNCGQLKALVAIGTESQINKLQQTIENRKQATKSISQSTIRPEYYEKETQRSQISNEINLQPVYDKSVQAPEIEIVASKVTVDSNVLETERTTVDASTQSETMEPDNIKSTVSGRDILNSFMEQVLSNTQAQKNVYVENSTNIDLSENITEDQTNETENSNLRNTSDLLESLQKALAYGNNSDNVDSFNFDNPDSFKVHIVIDSALHLPSRRKCKSKRNKPRGAKHCEEILPSTYVTFKNETDSDMIVTNVVAKSTSPRWDFRYDTQLPAEFLLNNSKRLIFKVWRRSSATSLQPNFQTDVVIGFAALDLTVLLSGLPNVQGWFNIVDFSSKCNGQIKIHVTPLENLSRFNKYKYSCTPEKPKINFEPPITQPVPVPEQSDENSRELFNRALKRKFTELEEITQRLKQRLSKVTNDDSDMSDEFADEFEKDLNTECIETEKVNFDNLLKPVNIDTNVENFTMSTPVLQIANETFNITQESKETEEKTVEEATQDLDRHLNEGKLRIDSLLEKLSLITETKKQDQKIDSLLGKLTLITDNDSVKSFSNRYVSGCSIDQDTTTEDTSKSLNINPLLKQFNLDSDVDPDLIFNPLLFQQMFTGSNETTPRTEDFKNLHSTTLRSLIDSTSSSSTSMESYAENSSRQAPEGAGIADSQLK